MDTTLFRRLAAATCAWLALAGPAAAEGRSATLDDVLAMQTFGTASLSPDRRWLVYERRGAYDEGPRFDLGVRSGWATTSLHLVRLGGGASEPLLPETAGVGYLLGPWSPDGARLVVYRLVGDRFEAGVVAMNDRSVRWTGLTPDWPISGLGAAWIDADSLALSPHAGFQLTQASDCAIVSAELSPAGVVQVLHHCWTAAMALLRNGVLIRGYVTRGKVHHAGSVVLGSGYHSAYQREQGVTAFRIEVDEVGTPFIEIDPVVQAYVETETDPCVREMTGRMTRSEGGVMAIYPFSGMSHSIMIGGSGRPFDAGEQKAANGRLRDRVQRYRDAIASQATGGSARAASKIRHYLAALDAQLEIADRTDVFIEGLSAPLTPPYRS